MALTDATLNALGDHLATLGTHLSLHSADPGTTGANETTAGRVAAGWAAAGTPGAGDIQATNKAFTGGAASGAVTHVGVWSASTGGTFRGGYALSGDQAFNAAGEYTVDSLVIAGGNV